MDLNHRHTVYSTAALSLSYRPMLARIFTCIDYKSIMLPLHQVRTTVAGSRNRTGSEY